ncbi:MAG: hypothetical protein IKK59_02455 [Lachnospiraceae bacterium]|nr:hypothetical protein [Lachnospiraceae bacterium]
MTSLEALEKLLPSFQRYYNIKREEITEPFVAEAEFYSQDESYFLMKSAQLSQSESKEYVFFAAIDHLDAVYLKELDEIAWNTGLSRVELTPLHRSTDVTLIILADTMDSEAAELIKKLKHYKSYCFTLKGWSRYRLIALETSTGRITHNHLGSELKKLISNIQK